MVAVLVVGEPRPRSHPGLVLSRLREQLNGADVFAAVYADNILNVRAMRELCSERDDRVLLLDRREVEAACAQGNHTQWRLLQWYQLDRLVRWITPARLHAYGVIVRTRPDFYLYNTAFRFASLQPPTGRAVAAISDLVFFSSTENFLAAYVEPESFFVVASGNYSTRALGGAREACLSLGNWRHDGCRLGLHRGCLTWTFGDGTKPADVRALVAVGGWFMSEVSMAYHLRHKGVDCLVASELGAVSLVSKEAPPPVEWLNSTSHACTGVSCLGPRGLHPSRYVQESR